MVSKWISCLDKRPCDRSREDLDIIYTRLKVVKGFDKFHASLLHQICYYGYYEDLEKGVTLFRQGDVGTNWYTVLSGCLEVQVSETSNVKDAVMICTLCMGTSFGDSILHGKPHQATVVTREFSELIRVEQRDFKILWERNKKLLEGVLTSLGSLTSQGGTHSRFDQNSKLRRGSQASPNTVEDVIPNPAAPISMIPSVKLSRAGHVVRTILMCRAPHMIRDRKYHLRTYRRCMVGSEMIDWLLQQGPLVHSRNHAVGLWQALLEDGIIVHVCHEHQFKDRYLFYRFRQDDQGVGTTPSHADRKECDEELQDTLLSMAQIGPDAMMRMILRKLPNDRTVEDLEIIYEELLHIKALSQLSTMVKRELASVLIFESHSKSGTVLFNQGDEGKYWYIILKGSVNVVIYGRGVVCTLHEADDFGKLAILNEAPRAATIVLREDNCHFLRVDKDDFNRILRDAEKNTERLKEHDKVVLVLERIPMNSQAPDGTTHTQFRHSVMAGTGERMLEYFLDNCLETKSEGEAKDNFQEVFLLTYEIFMPSDQLCPALLSHYDAKVKMKPKSEEVDTADLAITQRRRVVQFVREWFSISPDTFKSDNSVRELLQELHDSLTTDCVEYPCLTQELAILEEIIKYEKRSVVSEKTFGKRRISPSVILTRRFSKENMVESQPQSQSLTAEDENVFKVFCADHTYTTLRLPMGSSVKEIILQARDKLCLGNDLVLCEVKSTGERITFKDNEICVTTSLSVNGQLFISPREHIDALTPLPEQEGPTVGTMSVFEMMSTKEVAYNLTLYDWELLMNVNEYELIYLVIGRHNFGKITSNLDTFLRRFNEVQYWVVTEMVLAQNVTKRVQLLRKFIKLASHCKEYRNLNSFFAIVLGLGNIAVSRLSQTWEKVPSKLKKMYAEYEMLMDPSRNHRVYRLTVAKLSHSVVPFMPLLMKDLTFTHEGNKSYFDGLVNFEKMHMIAQTLRSVRICKGRQPDLEPPTSLKHSSEVSDYIRNLHVIDNQRLLTQFSYKLEPRRT